MQTDTVKYCDPVEGLSWVIITHPPVNGSLKSFQERPLVLDLCSLRSRNECFLYSGKRTIIQYMCESTHRISFSFLPFFFSFFLPFFFFLSRQSCYIAQAGLEQSFWFCRTRDGFLAWAHIHAGPSLTLLVNFLKHAAHGQHPQEYCRGLWGQGSPFLGSDELGLEDWGPDKPMADCHSPAVAPMLFPDGTEWLVRIAEEQAKPWDRKAAPLKSSRALQSEFTFGYN